MAIQSHWVQDSRCCSIPGSGVCLAASIQIFPAPWLGWGAISLPAKPEPILVILLLAEEFEHAGRRQAIHELGDLVLRARFLQARQQEADVG